MRRRRSLSWPVGCATSVPSAPAPAPSASTLARFPFDSNSGNSGNSSNSGNSGNSRYERAGQGEVRG